MAYSNPKPKLYDEETDISSKQPQMQSVAEYAPRKEVYFAFLDVLGFKQTFDENRENPDGEFALVYKDTFQYFSLLMNSTRFKQTGNQWTAGQTSDSLYFYTDREDYLAAFIKLYSHFCLYAMSQNVFFRGGIAKGGLFVEQPHQFYGDSVIKAYLLEDSIAKYPQIVLDQRTYCDLKKEASILDFLVEENPPKRNHIKPFQFISEAELQKLTKISAADMHSIGAEEWELIQNNIKKNMDRFEFDEKNYQKYAFLQSAYIEFQKTWAKE